VIPVTFEYVRPDTVEEALEALSDPDAKVLAGGHSLVPLMKLRIARPSRLVDISGLDLRGVDGDPGELRIGALTTYDDLLRLDSEALPAALRECAASVGDVQVRNAGTVGGGIAHGDPASDLAAGVLALDGRLQLRSPAGTRECDAESFFLGPFTTAIEQQELLTAVLVRRHEPGEGSAYVSIDDPASGFPLAGAAVRVRIEDGKVEECRVGLTGIGAHPLRAQVVEEALSDGDGPAVREAVAQLEPAHADERAEYGRQLTVIAITRAAEIASQRATAGGPG
jgi:aerobic carbon-monoxide dehydrogenase medium subunit